MILFRTILFVILSALLLQGIVPLAAQNKPYIRDVVFAEVSGKPLKLDLYLPEKTEKVPPLVVWIHGGSWRGGNRYPCEISWLTKYGYAVASISYRFSQQAPFPAQIHDCKAAIRWLRAQAADYGYDPERVAVGGASAGGMLAVLIGASSDVSELEGTVGGFTDQSSRVSAIINYYGASDFILRSKNQPDKTDQPKGLVYQLLGAGVLEEPDLARKASPAFHVSKDDPPLLIFHGDRDKQVLPGQSRRLLAAYKELGLPVEAHFLSAGHGGGVFFHGPAAQALLAFLDIHFPTDSIPQHNLDNVLSIDPPHLTSTDSKPHGGRVRITLRRDGNYYLRLMPRKNGESNSHARQANQHPIVAGNAYRLVFERRIPANENQGFGKGHLQITLGALPEAGTSIEPATVELQKVLEVGKEWETFTYDWKPKRNYTAGEFRIEFRPVVVREYLQVRSISLTRLGEKLPPTE